jgi:hypothetical protein
MTEAGGRAAETVERDLVDDLVFQLLELAARKLVVPSWPKDSPPKGSPDVPVIEARRDDEGALGVYRFAVVVDDDALTRPAFEVRLSEARALDADVKVGDEVGIELPLPVVCAVAVADIDAGGSVDLGDDLSAELERSGLKDAVVARLRLLRGPPPSSPELSELRALVSTHGGMAVRWTLTVRADADAPDRLVCCVERGDVVRLVVVDAVRGAAPKKRLLAALLPPPAPRSLWTMLKEPGLLVGATDLVVDEDGARVALVVDDVSVDDDPARYGHVTARGRWTRTRGDRVVGSDAVVMKLDVDVAALVSAVDDAGAARVAAAAQVFRARVAKRLAVDVDAFAGAAFLRVLARAAQGSALVPRAQVALGVVDGDDGADGADDGSFAFDVYGHVVRVVPADNSVVVDVKGVARAVYVDGALVDGDVEAFCGVCGVFADVIAGSDVDVDLVFLDVDADADDAGDGSGHEVAVKLSAVLRGLAERCARVEGAAGGAWLPADPVAARVWHDVVDCVLEER